MEEPDDEPEVRSHLRKQEMQVEEVEKPLMPWEQRKKTRMGFQARHHPFDSNTHEGRPLKAPSSFMRVPLTEETQPGPE